MNTHVCTNIPHDQLEAWVNQWRTDGYEVRQITAQSWNPTSGEVRLWAVVLVEPPF